MDKVEGWKEERWVGSNLAASMWIFTKAALCNGRKRVQTILAIIIESVSWVTEDFLWDHKWITETKVTMKENLLLEALHNDIEVPCPLQRSLLWFSAPTNLNRKFVNQIQGHSQLRGSVSCGRRQFCCATRLTRNGSWKKKCKGGAWGKIDLKRLSAVRGSVGREMNGERSH